MNALKKLYCRAYQTGLKLALPFLPYRKPKLISDVSQLPIVLQRHGCAKVLIVTDPTIVRLGLANRLNAALARHGISYVVYGKTVANPTSANVEEARRLYRSQRCQGILGFGGGSSIDCAKAVGARIARPDKPLKEMEGILKVRRQLPLLIAVPTTAGTGSETTLSAVITDSQTRHKYAINDFPLIPQYAVLDPVATFSLPPSITATTGMDALTHAVEAYIGNSTTRDTRRAALKAVRLIFSNIDKACQNGLDPKARKQMLVASYHAGWAFSKSYVGYIHAIAHSLGGEYGVPHGLANSVLLPFVLEAYGPAIHKQLHDLAIAAGVASQDMPHAKGAQAFIEAIQAMKKRLGIGDVIPQIQKKDIRKLARYADREANPLYPVPVLMDARELETFYHTLCLPVHKTTK